MNSVINPLAINTEMVRTDKRGVLDMVKKRFAASMHGVPFYSELIGEIIDEDYGENSELMQGNVLKNLEVAAEKVQKKQAEDHRKYILECLRILGSTGKSINIAMAKLNESSTIVEEYRQRQDSALRRLLHRIFLKSAEVRIYDVNFVDPSTSVERTMNINFDDFHKRAVMTARKVAAFSVRTDSGLGKIEGMSDDGLYEIAERFSTDVQRLVRTMPALHDYFQSGTGQIGKGQAPWHTAGNQRHQKRYAQGKPTAP